MLNFIKSKQNRLIIGLLPIAIFVLSGTICTTFDIFHYIPPEWIVSINVGSAVCIVISALILWNTEQKD